MSIIRRVARFLVINDNLFAECVEWLEDYLSWNQFDPVLCLLRNILISYECRLIDGFFMNLSQKEITYRRNLSDVRMARIFEKPIYKVLERNSELLLNGLIFSVND